MEVQITSSTFSEKDNKIEISNNTNIGPKLGDIKSYDKNINEIISTDNKSKDKSKQIQNLRFCYKIIGNTLCLLSDKYGNPLIMIGPHWPMYVCFCGLLTLGYISYFYHFFKQLNLFFKIFGISSYSLYFISYTGTFLLNPGYPERNEESLVGNPRIKYHYCFQCKIWIRVDMDASHCLECGVCIEGCDHHCPWTGKCIGRKTICYFYTFITSVFIVFLFFVTALFYVEHSGDKKKKIL